MRWINRIIFIVSLFLCGITAITVNSRPAVESFELVQTQVRMAIGTSQDLDFKVNPNKIVVYTDDLVWSSSNTSVVTVSEGFIEAVGVGRATITARLGRFKQDCSVEVLPIDVQTVSLDSEYSIIHPAETMQMLVGFTPSDATYKDVVWTSSDPLVATISETGLVTGVAGGQTTITVTAHNGIHTTKVVTVQDVIEVENFEIDINTSNQYGLTMGSYELTAVPCPSNADVGIITWTSSNSEVITVDSTGRVTVKKDGSATITAELDDGKTATIYLSVPRVEASIISISSSVPANSMRVVELRVGQTTQLSVSFFAMPGDPKPTTRDIIWSSDYEACVSVDENGLVTALAEPSYPISIRITATVAGVPGVTAMISISVVDN
ncbi:MAG: Ig domain-containing protein [Clostridiales bacterium]|nr:Ig domain-containing protein [Clostridiales bacterium]